MYVTHFCKLSWKLNLNSSPWHSLITGLEMYKFLGGNQTPPSNEFILGPPTVFFLLLSIS